MAEKNLFIYIFLRLGLEPYNFCTNPETGETPLEGRLYVYILQLPPKRRARGIVADAVPDRFLSDPGRVAGSGFLIRIRIAVLCRWGRFKNLRYIRNFTGKSNPLNNTGPRSHLGS
jgi:hypothetical protein